MNSETADLGLIEWVEQGIPTGRGNLLGIQPWMNRADYASEAAFIARLNGYLQAARQKGWVNASTVVVLPEYLGTWLVVAGENPSVYKAPTIAIAGRAAVARHPLAFARALIASPEKDRLNAALLRMKADQMARIYSSAFARLAREYGATIVAGSIILPDPRVVEGRVMAGKGALYNTSFVFHPDGRADSRVARKSFPTAGEHAFLSAAPVEDLPVYDTPAGRLGVLVCADAWFPEPYRRLRALEADLVAVPSAISPGVAWDQPWLGYSGWPNPGDVDLADVGALTEGQAWAKYSLGGRIAGSGARYGINVFLYGDLWDVGFNSGRWRMVAGDTVLEGSCDGPALLNLWL